MITLRHHLLSIVAVFLALAAGIVLGGGPLSDVGTRVANQSSEAPVKGEQAGAEFGEQFDAAAGPKLVAGQLPQRKIALVTLPGADEQVVTAITELIGAAGGEVSARVSWGTELLDPGEKALVDTLGSQLITQQAPDVISEDATTYDRMGELFGSAVASTKTTGEAVSAKSEAVLDAMGGAELASLGTDPAVRAPLALVVLGDDADDDATDAVLAGLLEGLARQAVGVVVAGSLEDGGDGQLARLRTQEALAGVVTVDGVDVPAGRTSAVLSLARAMGGNGGSFGASGTDGPAPLG